MKSIPFLAIVIVLLAFAFHADAQDAKNDAMK